VNRPETIPAAFLTEFRDRIARGDLELPLLPAVASRVMALTQSDSGSAAELSELIHRDQALAGQVMRVANAAVYARRGVIVSLKQAVTRLGTDLLTEIAMASMLGRNVFRVDGHEARVAAIWRHALASGCFAREIARIGRRNVESAFLCGLLHSIGKPIALNLAIELGAEEKGLSDEALTMLIARTHQHIGVRIAAKWKLPEPIPTAILNYTDYTDATQYRDAAATTFLATRLASWSMDAASEDAIAAETVDTGLNLYPDDLQTILGMKSQIEAFVDSLDQGLT